MAKERKPRKPEAHRYPSRETYKSVSLPKKLVDELQSIAQEQERSIPFIIKKACDQYIKAYRNKPKF